MDVETGLDVLDPGKPKSRTRNHSLQQNILLSSRRANNNRMVDSCFPTLKITGAVTRPTF